MDRQTVRQTHRQTNSQRASHIKQPDRQPDTRTNRQVAGQTDTTGATTAEKEDRVVLCLSFSHLGRRGAQEVSPKASEEAQTSKKCAERSHRPRAQK